MEGRRRGRVPRAAEAVVEDRKVVDYLLNPKHERGRHKARVFSSALGITAEDWAYLKAALEVGVRTAPIVAIRERIGGPIYTVRIEVVGLNRNSAFVVTGWQVSADAPPRLVSAYVET